MPGYNSASLSIAQRLGWVVSLFWSGRTTNPQAQNNGLMYHHLRRLAKTSPHLLQDVGFSRRPAQDRIGEQVWQSEHLQLVLIIPDGEPDIRIETRTGQTRG